MNKHKGQDYSHSLIDMMTSIAVIFILVAGYMASKAHRDTRKVEMDQQEKVNTLAVRDEIAQKLRETLKPTGKPIEITADPKDPSLLFLRISDAELQFGLDQDTIPLNNSRDDRSRKAKEVIDVLSEAFGRILTEPKLFYGIESIIIEGHTSRKKKSEDLLHNIKLSQDRSRFILEELIRKMERDGLKSRCPADSNGECLTQKLSSTGYWWNKPITKNAASQKNQRVEIKIKVLPLQDEQGRGVAGKEAPAAVGDAVNGGK